jgi:hypothetical protein
LAKSARATTTALPSVLMVTNLVDAKSCEDQEQFTDANVRANSCSWFLNLTNERRSKGEGGGAHCGNMDGDRRTLNTSEVVQTTCELVTRHVRTPETASYNEHPADLCVRYGHFLSFFLI